LLLRGKRAAGLHIHLNAALSSAGGVEIEYCIFLKRFQTSFYPQANNLVLSISGLSHTCSESQ